MGFYFLILSPFFVNLRVEWVPADKVPCCAIYGRTEEAFGTILAMQL
jgi:hypothetical protein